MPAELAVELVDDACLFEALKRGSPAFELLRQCVERSGEPCEGNLFTNCGSWNLDPGKVGKQKNLFSLARSLQHRGNHPPRILEIGFNAGHSVCLMLLANPDAIVTTFDLGEHAYVKPCAAVLQSYFGKDRLELIVGSSVKTLPAYHLSHPGETFDLLHIDGGHQFLIATADMANCRALAHRFPQGSQNETEIQRSLVVLDDTDITGIAAVWADARAAGHVIEHEPPHVMGKYQHGIGEFVCEAAPGGQGMCATCGVCPAPHACGGCRSVRYCCSPCGRAHWKFHRAMCTSRQPPQLEFAALSKLLPGRAGLLRASPDRSSALVAARLLESGMELCLEAPTAWQPGREVRLQHCSCCGAKAADDAGWPGCAGCGFAGRCGKCQGLACQMCPELTITRGTAAPLTLLLLDLLRRRHARTLPMDAFPAPPSSGVNDQCRHLAAGVQRVGHFCSAVRWTDEAAAEVVAAILPGVLEVPGAGLCYFPTLARLRATSSAEPHMGVANLALQVQPTPEHNFSLKVVLRHAVAEGSQMWLPGGSGLG